MSAHRGATAYSETSLSKSLLKNVSYLSQPIGMIQDWSQQMGADRHKFLFLGLREDPLLEPLPNLPVEEDTST